MFTTIDEIVIKQDGEIVLVEKTEIKGSVAYSRRNISPGDDYSVESEHVKQVCALVHSEPYLGISIPPVTSPDWDSFNTYMLSDPMFKTYRDAVRSIDGELTGALFDAYAMIDAHGINAFSVVWGVWVSVSGISETDRGIIADVARGYNLPGDFVSIIEV